MKKRPSRDEVRAEYRLVNELFFGGVLHPELPIHWQRMKCYGCADEPTERYPLGRIRLSTMHQPACGWRGVLLHECVHVYLDLFSVDEWERGPVAWHGPRFVEEVNRIGAELGLPPVTEESAWYWPMTTFEDEHPEPAVEE